MSEPKVVYPLRLTNELRDFLQERANEHQLSFNAVVVMSLARQWRFVPATRKEPAPMAAPAPIAAQTSRSAPCPCGSGAKYKRCHGRV